MEEKSKPIGAWLPDGVTIWGSASLMEGPASGYLLVYQSAQIFVDRRLLTDAGGTLQSTRLALAGDRRSMIALSLIMAIDVSSLTPVGTIWSDIGVERAVLSELNRARTVPADFARSLRDGRGWYCGNLLVRPGAHVAFLTQEGVAPVDEAATFVDGEAAELPLSPASVLAAAAADHQLDQRGSGMIGHAGRDGSTPADRVRRRGGGVYVGEVIAYGTANPADIVRQLIVDDGVADRGHRRLLYDASLRYAGISCGAHPIYRYMCVVTLGRTADGTAHRS